MYLEDSDEQKIIESLVKNQSIFTCLPQIEILKVSLEEAFKINDRSFHDDIRMQYFRSCKSIIAIEVGKETGLSADGIYYILDCMGLKDFKRYMEGKNMPKRKPTKTKKSGNGSKRK